MLKSFQDVVNDAKTRIKEVTITDVKSKLAANRPFVLVDVREDAEWAKGHAPSAVHLGRGVLERDAAKKLARADAEIVLYCGAGNRSALAADSLQQMGYTNVYSLAGGFGAWREAGMEVKTD